MCTSPELMETTAEDRKIFGDKYRPPDKFELHVWYKVAAFPREEGEETQDAFIYEFRSPARSYRVVAMPDRKNFGYVLETGCGSDLGKLSMVIAYQIANGMFGVLGTFKKEDDLSGSAILHCAEHG